MTEAFAATWEAFMITAVRKFWSFSLWMQWISPYEYLLRNIRPLLSNCFEIPFPPKLQEYERLIKSIFECVLYCRNGGV